MSHVWSYMDRIWSLMASPIWLAFAHSWTTDIYAWFKFSLLQLRVWSDALMWSMYSHMMAVCDCICRVYIKHCAYIAIHSLPVTVHVPCIVSYIHTCGHMYTYMLTMYEHRRCMYDHWQCFYNRLWLIYDHVWSYLIIHGTHTKESYVSSHGSTQLASRIVSGFVSGLMRKGYSPPDASFIS